MMPCSGSRNTGTSNLSSGAHPALLTTSDGGTTWNTRSLPGPIKRDVLADNDSSHVEEGNVPDDGRTFMSEKKKKSRTNSARSSHLLSDEELSAMKETLKERRRARAGEADGESDVLAKIAEMAEPDRSMAKRLHAVIKASAPNLVPRTWYGMPAYTKDGKVVCFFKSGKKYKSRYATFGFEDAAKLDDGDMWTTSFALKKLTADTEKRIGALVKKAAS